MERTTYILSLTAKQGVIPYDEKEGGGNKPKEDVSAYRLAYPGDIVMNSMNILSGSVGLSQYFGCVSPVYYMLRPKEKDDDVRYYNYIFQTTLFQRSLFGLGNGILIKESGNGKLNTIRMRIPMDKFGGLYIPIAPKDKQRKISDFLDAKCGEIDILIKNIQEEIDVLEDYKKSIISEGVTRGLDCNSALKDSGIFYMGPIKETWSISKIGYICTKLSRGFLPEDTALVCSNKGKVLIRDENAVGKMVSEDNAMQGIKKGDIAIHGMDTWHGAIALSEYDGKITRVVHVCDSNEDKRFVVYYMQYLAFQGVYKLISNGVRGNTSDFRSWDKVKDIYIPLPESREEQKKICDHLDLVCKEIETAIDNKREQLDMLEQYKKIDLYNEKVQLFVDASGEKSKHYYFSEFEIDDENQDNLAEIEDVALNSDAYTVIEKPTPSDSYMILFWKVGGIEERLYPDIIKIEENEFFYKKYVFYYTEKELQCFKKWCSSLKTNGKPMLDTVLEEVQLLNDESEQVQFLTRLLSKVPFFNPIFPKAVMNDFGEMVRQKIDGIRKQKKNVEMINDMFIRSIEETSFNVEVLSDMIYQKILEE